MKVATWGLCLAWLVSGCGSFAWRIETKPPAWSESDWTRELGAPMHVKVDGDTVYVGAEGGVYAMRAGGAKLWATPLPPAKRYLTVGEGKVAVTSYSLGAKKH